MLEDKKVPIILTVHAEPDGYFIKRDKPQLWKGFESSLEQMTCFRDTLQRATGRPVKFTWMFRLDPQIADTYGDPAWPLLHYQREIQQLLEEGDEIGTHVHTFRWSNESGGWVADYADSQWVEHCVLSSLEAYRRTLGMPSLSFCFGDAWMDTVAMNLIDSVGVEFDLTLVPGDVRPRLDTGLGEYRGNRPSFLNVPPFPYRPSPADFRVPSNRTNGIRVIPLSTAREAVATRRWWRSWSRRVRDYSRRLGFTQIPNDSGAEFNYILNSRPRPYFSFVKRSNGFLAYRNQRSLQRAVRFLADHPRAAVFAFETPLEACRLLEID